MTSFHPITTTDPRKGPEGYCGTCGALVRWSETTLHHDWHAQLSAPAPAAVLSSPEPVDVPGLLDAVGFPVCIPCKTRFATWDVLYDHNVREHPEPQDGDTVPAAGEPAYAAQDTEDWGPRVTEDLPSPEMADRIRTAFREDSPGVDRGSFSQYLEGDQPEPEEG